MFCRDICCAALASAPIVRTDLCDRLGVSHCHGPDRMVRFRLGELTVVSVSSRSFGPLTVVRVARQSSLPSHIHLHEHRVPISQSHDRSLAFSGLSEFLSRGQPFGSRAESGQRKTCRFSARAWLCEKLIPSWRLPEPSKSRDRSASHLGSCPGQDVFAMSGQNRCPVESASSQPPRASCSPGGPGKPRCRAIPVASPPRAGSQSRPLRLLPGQGGPMLVGRPGRISLWPRWESGFADISRGCRWFAATGSGRDGMGIAVGTAS
jgi:hypothetical protein